MSLLVRPRPPDYQLKNPVKVQVDTISDWARGDLVRRDIEEAVQRPGGISGTGRIWSLGATEKVSGNPVFFF